MLICIRGTRLEWKRIKFLSAIHEFCIPFVVAVDRRYRESAATDDSSMEKNKIKNSFFIRKICPRGTNVSRGFVRGFIVPGGKRRAQSRDFSPKRWQCCLPNKLRETESLPTRRLFGHVRVRVRSRDEPDRITAVAVTSDNVKNVLKNKKNHTLRARNDGMGRTSFKRCARPSAEWLIRISRARSRSRLITVANRDTGLAVYRDPIIEHEILWVLSPACRGFPAYERHTISRRNFIKLNKSQRICFRLRLRKPIRYIKMYLSTSTNWRSFWKHFEKKTIFLAPVDQKF